MTNQHPEDHPLSPELRVTMAKIVAVGFMDRMAGQPVEDDDVIQVSDANTIFGVAEVMVDRASEHLADAYRESPETVYEALYMAGVDAADKVEVAAASRN